MSNKNLKSIEPYTILLYAQGKVGLSTIASKFPDPVFLNLDDKLGHLGVNEVKINSWQEFLSASANIQSNKFQCKTIVISHIDRLYDFAASFIKDKFNASTNGNARNISEWGYAEYRELQNLFDEKLKKLIGLGYRTVLLSKEYSEIRNVNNIDSTHFILNLEKKVQVRILQLVDACGRIFIDGGDNHVISFVPQAFQLSGSNIKAIAKKYILHEKGTPEFITVLEKIQNKKTNALEVAWWAVVSM